MQTQNYQTIKWEIYIKALRENHTNVRKQEKEVRNTIENLPEMERG